tara:strand:+ start:1194 stop:1694 length:501 start_codon:yes stop_codon:yes gene_type:complete
MDYKNYIKEVSNFPINGVNFKDISPLLSDNEAYTSAIENMGILIKEIPAYWVGIDARGFLFASSLAVRFGGGVILCRKAGKLPDPTIKYSYKTEYSEDELSIHPGTGTVVIVDDVLATGGTLQAVNHLCKKAGYNVADNLVLIDLQYIPREHQDFDIKVKSLVQYA